MPASAHTQLEQIRTALPQLRSGEMRISQFATVSGRQTDLFAALPPRFEEVLMQLLTRLESGALFSEESCSFSQADLLANLDLWVEKAALHLQKAG
ncbi:MAG: hypothetical protein EOO28_02760 [Comamonadaceae bacterium]|nr:MAG: hypothetical protein EOO28_02760 [Comamonadaceae bacterium]